MLGKLIKYEWKSTYKVGLILLAAIALVTLLGFMTLLTPFWQRLAGLAGHSEREAAFVLILSMSLFSIVFYIIFLMGVVYAAFIYLIVRFYRTMYTNEGYLLHTLPVSKHQILISKILVSSVWIYLIYLAMFASMAFFSLSVVHSFRPDGVWRPLLPEDFVNIGELILMSDGFGVGSVAGRLLSILAVVILGIPASITTFFGAVSMGQLFSRHRVLMAILSYIGIMIVSSVINAILMGINTLASAIPIYQDGGFSLFFMGNMYAQLVTNLIIAVGCYLASYYVTSKKLNMD